MKSIRAELLLGLAVATFVSALMLAAFVFYQYGLWAEGIYALEIAENELIDHVAIPLVIFIFLAGIGAVLIVNRIEAKLTKAADRARDAADSLTAYQAPLAELPLEIQPFVEGLNRLVGRLAEHAERQEAFAADAAHELKTPLAILALELDTIPSEHAAKLAPQIEALSKMVDQLLLLARCNSLDLQQKKLSVSVSNVCKRVATELAPGAIIEGKSVSFEENNPTDFAGLEEAIIAAVRTLSVNAINASPDGGEVCIIAGPGPKITIADEGAGLTKEKLDDLRARGKRSDRNEASGTGLGLAIADRIALAHEGALYTCMPDRTAICFDFSKQLQSKNPQ